MAAERGGDGENLVAAENAAVRIVRVGQYGEIGVNGLGNVRDLDHAVSSERCRLCEFRIGGPEHNGASGGNLRRCRRQQDLCAGRRHHVMARRRAIGHSRGGGDAIERRGLRQPRVRF
jgi:hypothetical protein